MSDPEDRTVDGIYDALDRGDPAAALELAGAALRDDGADPVLHFLAGVALLELDRPDDAAAALGRAVELDPDDPEFRANLSLALFAGCRFDESSAEAEAALERDDSLPDAHFVAALNLERRGRTADADAAFARAAELDPDAFPAPLRLGRAEFERRLTDAEARLPEPFRSRLDEVVVTVEPLPSDELLRDEPVPLDPELFGLFVGVPLTERSTLDPGGELPARILLFQRNLERAFPAAEQLTAEIARTLYHELGHYLGMDEDDLDAAGFA
jgi:predicted Zn-dependent protease with MMP-like domain